MRSKFKWIFALLLAFSMQFSFAQEKTITGVVSENGMPLPGATVSVKGTTRGTQTDFDGKYSIKASAGEVIEFSYVGMKTQSAKVGASSTVSVTLSEDDAISLGEVVVVGYGTTTKEAYVGTAAKVEMKNIQAKAISNVSQALVGEVAGVTVINTSGQPGSDATIRIRGFGSVSGNRTPLYVVDGVPFEGNVSSINPSDIGSMTILKDATATAVYGARGANGVIVITTRAGSANRSSIEVDFKTGINVSLLPRYSKIESPEEFIGMTWDGLYNQGLANGVANPTAFANSTLFNTMGGIDPGYNMWNVDTASQLIDPVTRQVRPGVTRKYNPENWEDYGFQTSYRQEANVRFSGGDDKTKYFSSFGYVDDQGYIVNSDYKRYTTRLNVTHQAREWLKGTASLGYTVSRSHTNGQTSDTGSIFFFVDNIPSIYPLFLRDADGNKVADPFYGGYQYDYGAGDAARGFGGLTNSIADATFDKKRRDRHELNGTFSMEAKLTKDLTFEARYGLQFYDDEYNDRRNPFYGSAATQFGSLFKQQERYFSQNFLQLLRYKKAFGNHNVEAFVAHESNVWKQTILQVSKNKVIDPDSFDLDSYIIGSAPASSWTNTTALESYFSQFNYNYDGKYYLTASVRRDGSSRFKEQKWDTFGSVGASWIISKESFLQNSKSINFLKLKTSYGIIGDQAGLPYWSGNNTYKVTNLDGTYSVEPLANGNKNLTWETAKIFQVGLETSLFNNFIDINVDYYVKNTDNLFFLRRVGPAEGIATIQVNDGQLRNTGIEFDVLAHLVKNEGNGFNLDLGVNGEMLKNKLTKMPIDPSTGNQKIIDVQGQYAWTQGGSIYDFYMREYAGVDAGTGVALWNQYYDDVNNDGIFDAGDITIPNLTDYNSKNPEANVQKRVTSDYASGTLKDVGKSAIPKVRGAFRLNASYKNFDLSTQFTYSLGGYAYDGAYAGLMSNDTPGSNNFHTDMRNRWQQPGDVTDVPALNTGVNGGTFANSSSTRFLTKSDYLAMNNIRLGYTIPNKWIENSGVSNVNLFVSGDNLMLLSKRDGFNPATSEDGGSSTYRYSPLSTFTMGVRLEF